VKYQLLPQLSSDDMDRLKASIVERGVKMPVVLDENGEILDGHNRVMIADSLGIDYPRIIEVGLDEHEKRIFVAELNAARRQMTDAQKIMLGIKIEPDIAARAEKRRIASLKQGSSIPSRSGQLSGTGETRDEVARTVQLGSGKTYERGRQVVKDLENEPDAEQLMTHLDRGDWDMDDARKELKSRNDQRLKERQPVPFTDQETERVLQAMVGTMAPNLIPLEMSQDALRVSGQMLGATSKLYKLPLEFRQQAIEANPSMRVEYEKLLASAAKLTGAVREMLGVQQHAIRRIS
jgi:ParB-like chromosome segregation protein Spo0J